MLLVVEVHDEIGHRDRQFDDGRLPFPIEQFDLHCSPEGLHRRVVVALTG
jgi:hypothetical protein